MQKEAQAVSEEVDVAIWQGVQDPPLAKKLREFLSGHGLTELAMVPTFDPLDCLYVNNISVCYVNKHVCFQPERSLINVNLTPNRTPCFRGYPRSMHL